MLIGQIQIHTQQMQQMAKIFSDFYGQMKERDVIRRGIEYQRRWYIRDWMKLGWCRHQNSIIRLRVLSRGKSIDYWNLVGRRLPPRQIRLKMLFRLIDFIRYYRHRYNLTARRGISSYNHDRLRLLSLK